MRKAKLILTILLTFAGIIQIYAQQKYQVVTRLIEDSYDYVEQIVKIDAEKANIEIKTWDKNKISLKLKLIAKHPDLAEAKKASNYLKYIVNNKKKELFIKNYLLINDPEELSASLITEYELYVPKNCHMSINNSLGNIIITDYTGSLKINQSMGDISIHRSQGELLAFLEIGDFTCNDINLKATINAEYSEMNLRNVSGELTINAKMGSFSIQPKKEIQLLDLQAENTSVNFINSNCWNYNLLLRADHGDIKGLNQCNYSPISIVKNTTDSNNDIKEFNYLKRKDNSKIKITTKYSDINLF